MPNLWSTNHPRNFWKCQPDFPDEVWNEALARALPILGLAESAKDADSVLELTLGEAQFGPDRYRLGLTRRLYYQIKPLIPPKLRYIARQMISRGTDNNFPLAWPVEPRFAQFLWEILRQAMLISNIQEISFRYFWPNKKRFALILTHDVETQSGQSLVPVIAELEASFGFRSSFNFVPERYRLDQEMIRNLRNSEFEIGVHGLNHDGKSYISHDIFQERVKSINKHVTAFRAVGFRSPLTHRNPEWMQSLNVEYDLSFFDTDPYEPMPGGTMSIWPFSIGHFVELPYTLPQDGTLINVLNEKTSRLWHEKLSFIKKYHGMALMLVHPDYSGEGAGFQYYADFLRDIKSTGDYWHILPRDMARWWRNRAAGLADPVYGEGCIAQARIVGEQVQIEYPSG